MRKFCVIPNNTHCQRDPEYSDCQNLAAERINRYKEGMIAVPVVMYERGDLQ